MAVSNFPEVLWSAEDLSLSIGSQILYDNTRFSIHSNERVALVGRNGCGKSTLMQLIYRSHIPVAGEISRMRNLNVTMLPQDFELDSDRTVAENVRDGLQRFEEMLRHFELLPPNAPEHAAVEHELMLHDGWNLENKLSTILTRLDLDGDILCGHLSGGEKRRTALARAIIGEPDLLLLDEPTNHLDVTTVEWIEGFLNDYRGSVLFVTHDRCFLDRLATRIVELDHGKFYEYEGSYADFLAAKADREANEDVLEGKRRKFLRSEIEWVRRSPKARLRRNLGRLRNFDKIAAQNAPQRTADIELLIPSASRLGNKTVDLKDVSLQLGGKKLIDHFSFEFAPCRKIGVVGGNGIGKSTLIKLIVGALAPDSGEIKVADTVEFNYVDQSRLAMDPENTVREELSEGVDTIELGSEKISVWGYLKRFLFEDERINAKIKYLSGGEKARLTLAKILKRSGNFLILDEPTNDLDLSSLRLLEEALCNYNGCVLVVSHDRYFLNRVCDGILGFEGNGAICYNEGDYDYYWEKRKEREATATAALAAPKNEKNQPPPPPPVKKNKIGLSYKENKELEGMESAIGEAEAKIGAIEARFCDPEFFKIPREEQNALHDEHRELQTRCAALYDRWEELEAKKQDAQSAL